MTKFGLMLIPLLTAGCAMKSVNNCPPLNARTAMLQEFEPSGSPCTDFVQINLLNAGCSDLVTSQPEPTIMYFACNSPQPGAQDAFSTRTWVFISSYHPHRPPDEIMPVCGDESGMLGISEMSIHELTGTSPTLEHPIYEGD